MKKGEDSLSEVMFQREQVESSWSQACSTLMLDRGVLTIFVSPRKCDFLLC